MTTPFVSAGGGKRSEGGARVSAYDRPSLLLRRPEPIALRPAPGSHSPGHALATFSLGGRVFDVVAAGGPERIEEPWWEGGPRRTRDYYRLETPQRRTFWVFRELGSGRWFLHGEWA